MMSPASGASLKERQFTGSYSQKLLFYLHRIFTRFYTSFQEMINESKSPKPIGAKDFLLSQK